MDEAFKLRRARARDAQAMAQLHRASITAGFLGSLGGEFLAALYKELCEYPPGHALVAESGGKVAGFVVAVDNTRSFYLWFIRKRFFRTLRFLLPRVVSGGMLRRMLETLTHPFRHRRGPGRHRGEKKKMAELLSVAVAAEHRGRGVGGRLVRRITGELSETGLTGMEAVVGHANPEAAGFYKKLGFTPVREMEMHKGEGSTLFYKDVSEKTWVRVRE